CFVGDIDDHSRRAGSRTVDLPTYVGGCAIGKAQGLLTSVGKLDRHRLCTPVDVCDDALGGLHSVACDAVDLDGSLALAFGCVVHDHSAALIETAQHIVTGRCRAMHQG